MGMLSMSDCLANALENYVHEPDASFAWKQTDQKKIKDAIFIAPGTHFPIVARDICGAMTCSSFGQPPLRQPDIAMLFIADDSYNARDEKEVGRFHESGATGRCGRRHSQQGTEPTALRWSQGGRLDRIYF